MQQELRTATQTQILALMLIWRVLASHHTHRHVRNVGAGLMCEAACTTSKVIKKHANSFKTDYLFTI